MRRQAMTGWIGAVVLLAIVAVAALVALGMRTPHVTVTPEGLTIRNSLFGRTIPIADLRIAEARVIERDQEPRLAPRWRTWGVGLPGHLSGWFRLNDGETALAFLGPANRALYIPTRKGHVVLVTPDDPDALLLSLRRAGEAR